MNRLQQFLLGAKSLAKAPHEPAAHRAARADLRSAEDMQFIPGSFGASHGCEAVKQLMRAIVDSQDAGARGALAEALSQAVDGVRTEIAHHAATLAQGEPRRHWVESDAA